jgi:hypothetical protein
MKNIMNYNQLVSWLYRNGWKYNEAVRTSMVTLTVLLNNSGGSREIARSRLALEWKCQLRYAREKMLQLRAKGLVDFEVDGKDRYAVYYFHRLGPKP